MLLGSCSGTKAATQEHQREGEGAGLLWKRLVLPSVMGTVEHAAQFVARPCSDNHGTESQGN